MTETRTILIEKSYFSKYASELESLLKSSFGICCNANDFFAYASADSVTIDEMDLCWVLPMYSKYKNAGLDACIAYIAKQMPITPHQTEEFKIAYSELEKLNPTVYSEY